MARALELARGGVGRVEPNPPVGAVVVDPTGRVVGEGWHRELGAPHAEVEALREAGEKARGATVHVTLEPCCHHGRTPPCVDALLAAGVARVVYGACDPDPRVQGRGLERLRAAGVAVERSPLADACGRFLRPYRTHRALGRPHVTLKWGMSLDGRVATRTGESRWITGEEARRSAHRERSRACAILVGSGTVLADDPELTCRLEEGRSPHRVVLDRRLRTPVPSRLVATAGEVPLEIYAGPQAGRAERRLLEEAGARVEVVAEEGPGWLLAVLAHLARERGVTRLLVEGGPTVHGAFVDAGTVDRVLAYVAPVILGGAGAPSCVAGTGAARLAEALSLDGLTARPLGPDLLLEGETPDPVP